MCALSEYLADKKILILGMGKEGRSSLEYIRRHAPTAKVALADRRDPGVEGVAGFYGEDYLSHMDGFDLVLKSPGIPFVGVTIPVLLDSHQPEQLQENLALPCLRGLNRVLALDLCVYVVEGHAVLRGELPNQIFGCGTLSADTEVGQRLHLAKPFFQSLDVHVTPPPP